MINQVDFLDDEVAPVVGDSLQKVRALNIFIGSAWRKTGLDPYEWAVFCILLSHADSQDWKCYPSAKTLADECKMSRARVFTALKVLKDRGFISIEHRNDHNGSLSSSLYKIGIPPSILETTLVHQIDYPSLSRRQEGEPIEGEPREVSYSSPSSKNKNARARISAFSAKPKKEELDFFVTSLGLTQEDSDAIWDYWLTNGFRTKTGPIRDWQAAARNYKRQGWLPSRKFHKEQPKPVRGVVTTGVRPSL